MSLRLYNSRTRAVEPFVPCDPANVRIYVCGLTPSAEAHLGHARSFLLFDVLRRYLAHLGFRVTFVRNVTDIDDRSIAAAQTLGVSWHEVVAQYDASFKRSMDRLRVLEPDREPYATHYIDDIVATIAGLIERGHAYAVADGVYFSVASFARYGALSGRNTDELLVGARIAPGEDKRDQLDFALWKIAKPGEPSWPSPWGEGRPGWHIECSAMAHALLGEPFDIHGGGYDLIFPHHENEVAQSESLWPAPMANVWMHGGLLQFDGRKMSKSLGNFEPLSSLLDRHDPQAIRLLFLQTGYRKPMNFTESAIDGATTGLRRLSGAYDALRRAAPGAADRGAADAAVAPYRERFFAALDDDMNTSGAVSVLFDVAAAAAALTELGAASAAAGFMHEASTLLGLSPNERARVVETQEREDACVTAGGVPFLVRGPALADRRLAGDVATRLGVTLASFAPTNGMGPSDAIVFAIVQRQDAKERKDFASADAVRRALEDVGVALKDAKGVVVWSVAA